jgi:hypothetical protein
MLLAGLIIYAVLLTAAVIPVLLSNSRMGNELQSTKFTLRSVTERANSLEDDLRRTQADFKEVIEAWGEVGTKHARRRLRAHLRSSLGQKYASVLASLEREPRRIEKPDSSEEGHLPPVESVSEKSFTLQTDDGEIECELRPVDPTSQIPVMGRDVL